MSLRKRERCFCFFTLIVVLLSRGCNLSILLPRGAVGEVCDSGIFWPYSFAFWLVLTIHSSRLDRY